MSEPKSYEAVSKELNEILNALQDEATPLDTALKLYAKAAELMENADSLLAKADLQVQEIDKKMLIQDEG